MKQEHAITLFGVVLLVSLVTIAVVFWAETPKPAPKS
jgi:hypothetical protein